MILKKNIDDLCMDNNIYNDILMLMKYVHTTSICREMIEIGQGEKIIAFSFLGVLYKEVQLFISPFN